MLSTTTRTERGTRLGEALEERMREDPGSEKWHASDGLLKGTTDAKMKRTPDDRARLREKSFYVDISATGLGWSRPVAITTTEAHAAIVDAVNDYAVQRDRRINFPEDDALMAQAFRAMSPSPNLRYVDTRGSFAVAPVTSRRKGPVPKWAWVLGGLILLGLLVRALFPAK